MLPSIRLLQIWVDIIRIEKYRLRYVDEIWRGRGANFSRQGRRDKPLWSRVTAWRFALHTHCRTKGHAQARSRSAGC